MKVGLSQLHNLPKCVCDVKQSASRCIRTKVLRVVCSFSLHFQMVVDVFSSICAEFNLRTCSELICGIKAQLSAPYLFFLPNVPWAGKYKVAHLKRLLIYTPGGKSLQECVCLCVCVCSDTLSTVRTAAACDPEVSGGRSLQDV